MYNRTISAISDKNNNSLFSNSLFIINATFLLLIEEEYPNPCEPVRYSEKHDIQMDLGEVVEINHADFCC
jgi:hypothetical protein